jgi:putative redox protein
MRTERVEFYGALGSRISAKLDLPEGNPLAYAIFAHCFTCNKDLNVTTQVSVGLTHHGIAVLRFDFTGLGQSSGDFAATNFTTNMEDLLAASDWLIEHHQAPSLLVGHSLGGAAVLAVAHEMPHIKAVATIGAPAEPVHVTHNFGASTKEIEAQGEAEVLLAGRKFRIRKQFLLDIASHNLVDYIAELHCAILLFHSPIDEIVGVDNAARIFAAAKHPKSFISLDTADHLVSKREDAEYVADLLGTWAKRYI